MSDFTEKSLRYLNALISSLESPKMHCFGQEFYKGFSQKAAAYFFFIIKNNPFNDGNKRSAFLLSLVFLEMNGVSIQLNGDQLEELAISKAKSESTITEIAVFFESILVV